jgi:8-oxo-dGTP diphosphatase
MPINTDPHIHEQVICSNVFIRKDNKYLVLKRSSLKQYAPNIVQPVGGKVEPHENPYQAAVREAFEEAGVQVKNLKLEACSLETHPHDISMTDWFIFYFSADYGGGDIKNTEEGELMLLTAEEFKNQKLFPPLRKMISYIFEPKDGAVFASFELGKDMEVIKGDIKVCVV